MLDGFALFIAYFPFVNIGLGFFGNILTFIILRTNKELKKQSSMVMFSFIGLCDLVALFTWNLDTFFRFIYNISYEVNSLVTCRLMVFLQYFGLEASGLLFCFISVDRYFSIIAKPGSKLPFGTVKSSFYWSLGITISMFIFNSHILFLNGFENDQTMNQTNFSDNINCYKYYPDFEFEAFWDKVKMVVYSLIPSIVMIVFNTLIIVTTLKLGKNLNRNDEKAIEVYNKKRRLTICLITVTTLFPLMTLPNVIYYGFFNDYSEPWIRKYVGGFTNNLTFFHHACLFFSLFFTNIYFRKAVYSIFKKKVIVSSVNTTKTQ